MMFRNKILSLCLVSLFLCMGCTNDHETATEPILPKGTKAISITLLVNGETVVQPKTRGGELGKDLYNENKVDNTIAFLFDQDNNLVTYFEQLHWAANEKEILLMLTEKEASQVTNSNAKLILFANAKIAGDKLKSVKTRADLETFSQQDEFNSGKIQNNFLMAAESPTGIIEWDESSRIYRIDQPIKLSRAASKIRAKIEDINIIEDNIKYKLADAPRIRFVNYVDKTSLIKQEKIESYTQKTSDYFTLTSNKANGYTTSIPLYSYEQDWGLHNTNTNSYDSGKEPYLSLELKLQVGNKGAKSYYYRIPITYNIPTDSMSEADLKQLFKLQRNHLYEITAKINILGSEDPGIPLELDSKIGIQPEEWIDDIDGDISNINYLAIKEKKIEMPFINSYMIEYAADAPVNIIIDKVFCEKYDNQGNKEIEIYSKEKIKEEEIKVVTVSKQSLDDKKSTKTYIKIMSNIPKNNVPLNITFTVKHSLNREYLINCVSN